MVTKLNCNSLENICGWTVVLYGQSLLHRPFHQKSFTVTAKTTKLFHFKRFSIHDVFNATAPDVSPFSSTTNTWSVATTERPLAIFSHTHAQPHHNNTGTSKQIIQMKPRQVVGVMT